HQLVMTPSDCGTPKISPMTNHEFDRMVGGEEAVSNSWPWQVSLQASTTEPNGHFCGGTLINTLWVLTATHCVVGRANPGDIKIVLGSHGKFTKTPYQQVRVSAKVISYPELMGDDIKQYKLVNDVSLIRLNAPVELNAGVHPACLPTFGYNPRPGWHCYATGWGETRGTGSSHALKQTLQIAQSRATCRVSDEQTQVCVGNTGLSACHFELWSRRPCSSCKPGAEAAVVQIGGGHVAMALYHETTCLILHLVGPAVTPAKERSFFNMLIVMYHSTEDCKASRKYHLECPRGIKPIPLQTPMGSVFDPNIWRYFVLARMLCGFSISTTTERCNLL
ncbi:Plasminogen, partial [Araneus ventricosus]